VTSIDPTWKLSLGHVLEAAGIEPAATLVIRHTYSPNGLRGPDDVNPVSLLEYTRRQERRGSKFPKDPPALWLVFMRDGTGGRRSRFVTAYENAGEVLEARTADWRYFDIRETDLLRSLQDRLVVEWSGDTINWAKPGNRAALFPVIEVADPEAVPFPGFDNLLLTFRELVTMTEDTRYAAWRTALGAVQGIYLVADTRTGQLYVGKADGVERILGRWSTYAKDGHGGNVALRELMKLDPAHSDHFVFSILRVFGPSTPTADVDAAEAHFKNALLTRRFGLNRN